MSNINLVTPSLFGSRNFSIRDEILLFDDSTQRASQTGQLQLLHSAAINNSGTASAAYFNSPGGRAGVTRLTATTTAAGGDAAVACYGYFSTTVLPIILDSDCDYFYQINLRVDSFVGGSGTQRYFFFGLTNGIGIASPYTGAIGWRMDQSSAIGAGGFRASPTCMAHSVSTRLEPGDSIAIAPGDSATLYRSFLMKISHNSAKWAVSFFKLWDPSNTTGQAGDWLNCGSIDTNIPTVGLQLNVQDLTITANVGTEVNDVVLIDYISLRIKRKTKR